MRPTQYEVLTQLDLPLLSHCPHHKLKKYVYSLREYGTAIDLISFHLTGWWPSWELLCSFYLVSEGGAIGGLFRSLPLRFFQ